MPHHPSLKLIWTMLLFGFYFHSVAQEKIAPLEVNTIVQKQKASFKSLSKTTALTLPFFEDFGLYDAFPDPSKWLDYQTYINNTMAVNMLSRGVATFDALNQYGLPYNTSSRTAIYYADSLTSQTIDLSSFVPADSIYLSFLYQPAGNGFEPETQDSLMLFFKPTLGAAWTKIWAKEGSSLSNFKQVMLPITETKYLYNNFQFRFVNKASIGINDDVWNVDYIKIDRGRNINDTTINDIAFTITPSNLLNDYTSMPYRQYTANPSAERATNIYTIANNQFPTNQNIANYGVAASQFPSGTSLFTASGTNRNINAKDTTLISFGSYSSTPSAAAFDKVIFQNQFYISPAIGDFSTANDTIVGQQIFDNYLAYDDGTAEMSYYLNLFPTLPGKIAIEHHLNQPDTLRGLAIYFGRQVPLAGYKFFSIEVYKNIAYGSSTTDDLLYKIENLQPSYVDTINHFWVYKFDEAVPLPSGTFFVGTTQPALSGSDSLYFGLDRNRTQANHLYYNVLNSWSPSLVQGALMIRPLLGQAILGSGIDKYSLLEFKNYVLFPNPAGDNVQIVFSEFESNVDYEIKNILGQVVLKGHLNNSKSEISTSSLSSGQYFMHITKANNHYAVKKIIKK